MSPRPVRHAEPSSRNSNGILLPFTRPNLGDKLQRLGELSPAHVNDVEHLVDLMLKRLEG